MSDKLSLIVGPGDAYRGPATGHSPEHGDNWLDAVEKINAAIGAVNDMRGTGPSTAPSIATSNASSNAPSIEQRLEGLEIAVAEMMHWLGVSGAPQGEDQPITTPEHTPDVAVDPEPQPAPAEPQAAVGGAGDAAFGQPIADGPDAQPPASPPPAPLATFDGEPGHPVGSTIDENNDDNLFVISGADGRVEAAEPVEKQGQKPGADADSVEVYEAPAGDAPAGEAPVLNTTDSAPSPVELQPEAGAGSVNPGIAALADAEREIEAKQEPVDPATVQPNEDPFDVMPDPDHPPSQETIERADATAANNDRKGG